MKIKNIQLAALSAIVIGGINLASMGLVYAVFNSTHKPLQSQNAEDSAVAGSSGGPMRADGELSTEDRTTDVSDTPTGQDGAAATGTVQNLPGQAAASTGSTKPASGGTTTGSTKPSSGGTTPPAEPISLKKGAPCTTQVPPAGVCQSILSFNSQKDGNPNWSPQLIESLKDGVKQEAGGFWQAGWSAIRINLIESTWKGNATRGTITCEIGAMGRKGNIILQVDWNGSKWIVTTALGGGET